MGGIDEKIKQDPFCPGERELPDINEDLWPRLVLIVGHTKKSPGARFRGTGFEAEYDYNRYVAYEAKKFSEDANIPVHVHVVFRDTLGIRGAYAQAIDLYEADMIIELHFNSFSDNTVTGTETLCTNAQEDKKFATIVQSNICRVFEREGQSRGVKVLPRSARGGTNIYSAPGVPNCLVEPFFGSSLSDATMGFLKRKRYAEILVSSAVSYAKATGLME